MIRLTKSQIQPIGVDIGTDSIKMLQLETSGPTLSVHAALRQSFPEEARGGLDTRIPAAVEIIRQMMKQGTFAGRGIVAALPQEIVQVKNLRLPSMPPDEVASAVEFEARNVFGLGNDEAQIRHLLAGEVRQGTDLRQEVIVLAVRNSDITQFLEQLHHAGLTVESFDFQPAAIYRSVERFIRRREDEHEVHVLVDIGLRRSMVVMGKGRDMSFVKPIDVGGQRFHDAVARKLGISDDEARALRRRLIDSQVDGESKKDPVRQAVCDAMRGPMEEMAREIALCLRYYSVTFRGHRPSKVRLVGGEANEPHLASVLNSALPLPVEAARPLYSVNLDRMRPADRGGCLSEWAIAFGLGLKLTTSYFGARDGKPRESGPPKPAASAEVVEVGGAVADVPASTVKEEAVHA